jgi:hypothetical protein
MVGNSSVIFSLVRLGVILTKVESVLATSYNRARLIEIAPQWVVDADGPTVGEGFDRMANAGRDDRNPARPGDLGNAVNGHLKLALDDLIHFFLGMKMLVDGRITHEIGLL